MEVMMLEKKKKPFLRGSIEMVKTKKILFLDFSSPL